jgi:hypothetical protein
MSNKNRNFPKKFTQMKPTPVKKQPQQNPSNTNVQPPVPEIEVKKEELLDIMEGKEEEVQEPKISIDSYFLTNSKSSIEVDKEMMENFMLKKTDKIIKKALSGGSAGDLKSQYEHVRYALNKIPNNRIPFLFVMCFKKCKLSDIIGTHKDPSFVMDGEISVDYRKVIQSVVDNVGDNCPSLNETMIGRVVVELYAKMNQVATFYKPDSLFLGMFASNASLIKTAQSNYQFVLDIKNLRENEESESEYRSKNVLHLKPFSYTNFLMSPNPKVIDERWMDKAVRDFIETMAGNIGLHFEKSYTVGTIIRGVAREYNRWFKGIVYQEKTSKNSRDNQTWSDLDDTGLSEN